MLTWNGMVLRLVLHDRAEFHDLELDTTIKSLQALAVIGKCVLVKGDSDEGLVSYKNTTMRQLGK